MTYLLSLYTYRAMTVKPWLKALVISIFCGAIVAFSLYYFSEAFFKAKNKQTLVKSSDLGNDPDSEIILPVGGQVPDFKLKELDSNEFVSLKEDKVSVKIINFWASWCEPCVEEFSSFARLMKKFDEGDQLKFYAIGEDESLEVSKNFLKAFSSDFKTVENAFFFHDEDKRVSKTYGVLALPETFVVGPNGTLIRRVTGFENWDTEQAIKYFSGLIKKYVKGETKL